MSGKTYLRNQKYFKPNYFEALKYIIPGHLYQDDVDTTPKESDPVDLLINSHLDVASNFSSIINVSAVPDSVYSGINTTSGIGVFFVKQNDLTNITTKSFEDNVLRYFGTRFEDFASEEAFKTYTSETLLPAITLNNPNTTIFSSIGDSSSIHNYLINNLSWLYFLNTSGATYSPSAYATELVVSSLYRGQPVKVADGLKGISEHIWRNSLTDYYPSSLFASGTRYDLSGTQQLEKLKTWMDVIYSPLYSDSSDFRVRDKFEIFLESSLKSSSKIESGPFARLIRALSFLAYDISNDSEEIATLYDIDDCADEFLPLMAQLIGWDLFGSDPNRWRIQLRNAVSVYKKVGTKKSVQNAVDNVFPKESFPIESRITELWESYVPYLIYYSLATESSFFKDIDSWTYDLANTMNVGSFAGDLDTNIRLVVDTILRELIVEFPDKFPIATWIAQNDSTFDYRDRVNDIPPFEEYPYYVNVEMTQDMLEFVTDRLVCFGVVEDFALQVSSYISNNSLNVDEEPRAGSFLFFTSGYNSPPNLNTLVANISEKNIDYASLWSGKSSHFKLVLNSSEFDFTKTDLKDTDSPDALAVLSKGLELAAPAHSIPLLTLEVSGDSDVFNFESSCLPHVYFDRTEIDVAAGDNTFASGIYLSTYKRGINTSGATIGRSATQSIVSPEIINAMNLGGVPRNTSRRRSYEKVMPFNGYYDRTGFNMPVSFDMASDLSGIPLGLNPSAMTYTPVSSHINLPDIWAHCEGLNSNNTYYEYDVSTTQNIRGQSANFQANTDRSTDRGQLPGIYAAMHKISERRKYLDADLNRVGIAALESQIEELTPFSSTGAGVASAILILQDQINSWTSGVTTSYVNSAINGDLVFLVDPGNTLTNLYGFPTSVNDYYNFEFGRDLHRLYRTYQQNFNWHRLSPEIQSQDGANLFSHTFGPLLYNHDFDRLGTTKSLVASLFINPTKVEVTSEPFTGAGSFAASDSGSMYLDTVERVSSGILDGVELVLTSGTKSNGSFSLLRVPGSSRSSYEDSFFFDKTLILMRSGNDNSTRVRFDISKYAAGAGYPIATNFLSPDHEFKINVNSLVSNDSGTLLGGRKVGVWIHTKPEGGKMWTYTPDNRWTQHDQLVTRDVMFSQYAHSKLFEVKSKGTGETSSTTNYRCLTQVSSVGLSPTVGLSGTDFEDFNVNFNTRNRELRLPSEYQKNYDQLHRLNQNYVIEVFTYPGGESSDYLLLNKVEVQDLTLNKLSKIFAAGTKSDPLCVLSDLKRGCAEYRVDLEKQDLFDIFKHYNNIAGKNAATAYASRDKDKTEAIMRYKGGSRIDYRINSAFMDPPPTVAPGGGFTAYYSFITIPI